MTEMSGVSEERTEIFAGDVTAVTDVGQVAVTTDVGEMGTETSTCNVPVMSGVNEKSRGGKSW